MLLALIIFLVELMLGNHPNRRWRTFPFCSEVAIILSFFQYSHFFLSINLSWRNSQGNQIPDTLLKSPFTTTNSNHGSLSLVFCFVFVTLCSTQCRSTDRRHWKLYLSKPFTIKSIITHHLQLTSEVHVQKSSQEIINKIPNYFL